MSTKNHKYNAANDVDRPRSSARLGVEVGYLVLSTLACLAVNEIFKANYTDEMLHGSPEWSWKLGSFFHATVFPGAVMVSYGRSGVGFDDWLVGNVRKSSREETLFSFPVCAARCAFAVLPALLACRLPVPRACACPHSL